MSRARMALRAAGGLAVIAWWAPSLCVMLARLWGDRARFALATGLGRALAGVGAVGAARAVFAREAARCRRRMAVIAGRRGWQ